jgi:hypothetical protein
MAAALRPQALSTEKLGSRGKAGQSGLSMGRMEEVEVLQEQGV